MLSRMIVSSYGLILEVAIWLILIGSFIGGWSFGGFGIAILSLISAFIFCVVTFGALLLLVDIQHSVKLIEQRKTSS